MAEKEAQPEVVAEKPSANPSSAPVRGNHLSGRKTWHEVVGLTAAEAETKIKEETGEGIRIQVIPADSFVTMDYRTDRVRIFVDSSGKVASPPRIG